MTKPTQTNKQIIIWALILAAVPFLAYEFATLVLAIITAEPFMKIHGIAWDQDLSFIIPSASMILFVTRLSRIVTKHESYQNK